MATSKREVAYEYLREKIVCCELKPGDVLDEKGVAADLHCSRTPVREAINQLVEEHLVQIFPRKGIIVTQISLSSLNDMLDCRSLIEPYLLHQSMRGLNDEKLLEFKRIQEQRIADRNAAADSTMRDFDFNFHMYFAETAGNQYLTNLMKTLLSLNQRTRFFSSWDDSRILESFREHIDIIDAALNRDEEAGVRAMRNHLEKTRESYIRLFSGHVQNYFA